MDTSNGKARQIRVVGVDPSPGKLSTLFDGEEFRRFDAKGLSDYLDQLDAKTLVCWDSPLTGPANPDVVIGHYGRTRPYTQRHIEQFFSTNNGIKAPRGISVLPYSGCSHWTLSRALLGLPRVGKWDQPLQNLPFELVERNDAKERDWTRPKVVEVHPALALFIWSNKKSPKNSSWEYKKNSEVFKDVRKTFLNSVEPLKMPVPQDDDQLDALVAYVLGNRWLDGNGVVLLGNKDTGHFLIPSKWGSEDVSKKFSNFLTDC